MASIVFGSQLRQVRPPLVYVIVLHFHPADLFIFILFHEVANKLQRPITSKKSEFEIVGKAFHSF